MRCALRCSQVALHEATVLVNMDLVNKVTDVLLKPATVPRDGQLVATVAKVQVELETQDGRGLPWEAALEGLTLKLTPPGVSHVPSQLPHDGASGGTAGLIHHQTI